MSDKPTPSAQESSMTEWRTIDSAPKDQHILVYYDHDVDPYCLDNGKLTDYAAHAEGGDFLDGKGFCIAKWCEGWHESEDEYGNGYWMPGYWFAFFNGEYDFACNPTHWQPLPQPPETQA